MPKIKYKTEKERKEAILKNAKNYYELHKNDPKFKEKRRNYYKGYYTTFFRIKKDSLAKLTREFFFAN